MNRIAIVGALVLASALALACATEREHPTPEPGSSRTPAGSEARPAGHEATSDPVPQPAGAREPAPDVAGASDLRASEPGFFASMPPPIATDSAAALVVVRVLAQEDRAPLERANVVVSWSLASEVSRAAELRTTNQGRTDSDGEVRLPVGTGHEVRVRAIAPGGGNVIEYLTPFAPGETRSLTIAVPSQPDRRWTGVIVREEDDAPIAGATIEAYAWNERSPAPQSGQTVLSDELGRFTVESATWRPASYLRVSVPTRACELRFLPHQGVDRGTHDLGPIRLARAPMLLVRVQGGGGRPLAGLTVTATSDIVSGSGSSCEAYLASATTGADGGCQLGNLPVRRPIAIALSFVPTRVLHREPTPLELAPGERRELVIRLGGAARIDGTLVDESGRPMRARVRLDLVRVEGQEPPESLSPLHELGTITGKDGAFSFRDVPAGTWRIEGLGGGKGPGVVPTVVEVAEGAQTVEARVVYRR